MRTRFVPALLVAALWGCSSSPGPETSAAPPQGGSAAATPAPSEPGYRVVEGGGESSGSIPGSADAAYYFRFRQVDPPGGDRFTFQDRELSFYFRPTPDALHFQVENRLDRTVWIEWDRCVFYDPFNTQGKTAHNTTRWQDRFSPQTAVQVPGLQRYADYVFPMDYMVDPGSTDRQLHRQLLSEGPGAVTLADKVFGVDLVFRMEEGFRTYPFRFRVASVIPR